MPTLDNEPPTDCATTIEHLAPTLTPKDAQWLFRHFDKAAQTALYVHYRLLFISSVNRLIR